MLNNAMANYPRLYPKLECHDMTDLNSIGTVERSSIITVRNDLRSTNLNQNLQEMVSENPLHKEVILRGNKVNNELRAKEKTNPIPTSDRCEACEERRLRKCRRCHRRLRKVCKGLAFTVGLPVTLFYLAVRTSPHHVEEEEGVPDELDEIAAAMAKLLRLEEKNNT